MKTRINKGRYHTSIKCIYLRVFCQYSHCLGMVGTVRTIQSLYLHRVRQTDRERNRQVGKQTERETHREEKREKQVNTQRD